MKKYLEEYGYHFNEKLLKHASDKLKNKDGSHHQFTKEQVERAAHELGKEIKCIHDTVYIANWLYSDWFPKYLISEQQVIKAALDYEEDPDGYAGMPFLRYVSDANDKGEKIPWEEML